MSLEVENNLIRVNNQLCDFSKDGRFFATAYQTNLTIKGYKKLDTIHSFVFPDIIEYLEWSRNTEYILCANIKKAIIQVYSIRYPEWKYKLIEGSAGLESVSWSPDSKYILTLSDFNIQISVWSLDDQSVTHIQNMKSSFHKLYFSPDGNKLAVVVSIEGNDNIEIYKTDTWKLSKKLICGRLSSIDGLCWSPNSELLCIWSSFSDEAKLIIYSSIFERDIAVFSPTQTVNLSQAECANYTCLKGIENVTWMPSGQLLAVIGFNEMILLLNHVTWKPLLQLYLEPVIQENYLNKVYEERIIQPKFSNKNTSYYDRHVLEEKSERPVNIKIGRKNIIERLSIAKFDILKFSFCGQYLAVKHQLYPTTLWIWNIIDDYLDYLLLENTIVDGQEVDKNNTNFSMEDKSDSILKEELQTLRISEESERQLYDTLKHIYGPSFKLSDASEFENKKSNLEKQYWVERGNLVIKEIVDYSSKDSTPKSEEQITRQFATSKLESYGFHQSHCNEALLYTKGDVGKALEILFYKYYGLENIARSKIHDNIDTIDLLERKNEEKEALESIYGNMFTEKIKNQIWIVQVSLDYLVRNDEIEQEIQRTRQKQEKGREREVCRLFIHKRCRFGNRCKFLHQQPQVLRMPERENPSFTLEIRFPEGCKYPYEPPYFYLYKNDGTFPSINCLRIARRLYEEALLISAYGTPSIFSIISLLESEYDIKRYLAENKEQFLDQSELLFRKHIENEDETNAATHYELGSIHRKNRNNISWEKILKDDDLIEKNFKEKLTNPRYNKMIEIRERLPAWSKMYEILDVIHKNQVIIISGETGCGKSTQVPQFLLDDWIINRSASKEHINIICTQPRRISTIGVAERVASERNERIGDTVGYQIRLESKISNRTRLTFCTTGILLQRFAMNPELSDVTHVIVDEVHERSAESDFLLMLLKELLSRRSNLKVILMSATLRSEIFSTYFKGAPILCIPGRTFPVEQLFVEDLYEKTNYALTEHSRAARYKYKGSLEELEICYDIASQSAARSRYVPDEFRPDEELHFEEIISRYKGYNSQAQKNLYYMDHNSINYELIEATLQWIAFGEHNYPKTGSILVFLPGFAEIIALKDRLNKNEYFSPKTGKFIIILLHSSLSNEEQSLVFKKSIARKIVLSTNLAETSITIDDCVFVIDSGKMKETRFNSNQNMESLEMCWVSRANALQRKGRAGRVMPGVSIHLYTSYKFKYHFSAQPVPEILRIPLEPLLLRIQLLHNGKKVDLHEVLGKMLEPPTEENISSAIKRLQDVGAFNSECTLTPLGHHLAALPVNVRIGKLILFGAIFCCLDSALTIAACLSHKNPFHIPFEKRHEIDAKKEFFTANSDQLTILKAYKKWLEAYTRNTSAGHAFAKENYLSVRTLYSLADIKYQLLELLVSIGFVPVNLPKRQPNVDKIIEITGFELNINNDNYKLLQGLLCAALYPNVVKVLSPEKLFQIQFAGAVPTETRPEQLRFQTKNDSLVSIHPSSVNFHVGHFPSPYLVFQEKVKTSKIFIKEVSMVPILPLILFSDYELKIEVHDGIFIVSLEDGWMLFDVESHRVAQLLQGMRMELVKLLEQKMREPLLNLLNHQNGKKIIQTIVNVVTKE